MYLQTDILSKEMIHCQMVDALKELEKLWLVVVTMRSMLDCKTNKEKTNKKREEKKQESDELFI